MLANGFFPSVARVPLGSMLRSRSAPSDLQHLLRERRQGEHGSGLGLRRGAPAQGDGRQGVLEVREAFRVAHANLR